MGERQKLEKLTTIEGDFETTLNKKYRNRRRWEPVDPKKVLSFMPGTVECINVCEGDTVNEGQSLLIFRAMKMNNNILSPLAGKVKKIHAVQGQNVPKDALLIELE